jgi:hypothetical protein
LDPCSPVEAISASAAAATEKRHRPAPTTRPSQPAHRTAPHQPDSRRRLVSGLPPRSCAPSPTTNHPHHPSTLSPASSTHRDTVAIPQASRSKSVFACRP